jgi:heme exporter protein A
MGSAPRHTLLQASRLTKRFGAVTAVRKVDFQIYEGDFVSIFGPNGAGKTTLLRLIADLTRPTEGDLVWFPDHPDQLSQSVGFVSHQSLLYSELSGFENLLFFSRLYGVSQPRDRALELLEQMGLEHAGQRPVKFYSSGMKQRLTLARALAHDPEVLLLDEPYAGLDQHGGRLLTGLLEGLKGERRSILLITHNLMEGTSLADRVLIMNRGQVVHEAPLEELKSVNLERLYFGLVDG